MEGNETQVAIGQRQRQRRAPIVVEIGKERISRQRLDVQHPPGAEEQETQHAADAAGDQPHALLFEGAAQRHQRGGEADAERHFRQFESEGAAGDEAGKTRDGRRPSGRTITQRVAVQDQDRQPRQDEHAHHIVVIGGAEHRERERAGLAQQRQRAGADLAVGDAKAFARDQIKRHHIGALHEPQYAQRDPGMGVDRQPVVGNVEEGIVVARLMGDDHVQRLAVIEEGVRRVPVIIAEVPAGVLAQDDHERRPEQSGEQQERRLFGRKQAGCGIGTGGVMREAEPDLGWRKVLTRGQGQGEGEGSQAASPHKCLSG